MAEETTGPRGGPADRVGPGRTGGLAARRRPELPQLTRRAERRGARAAAAAARRLARRHLVDGRRALGRGAEAVGDALQGGLERVRAVGDRLGDTGAAKVIGDVGRDVVAGAVEAAAVQAIVKRAPRLLLRSPALAAAGLGAVGVGYALSRYLAARRERESENVDASAPVITRGPLDAWQTGSEERQADVPPSDARDETAGTARAIERPR